MKQLNKMGELTRTELLANSEHINPIREGLCTKINKIISQKALHALVNPDMVRAVNLKMFDEPEFDIHRPERSEIKEIPTAAERLKNKKTRVIKLLEQAT